VVEVISMTGEITEADVSHDCNVRPKKAYYAWHFSLSLTYI